VLTPLIVSFVFSILAMPASILAMNWRCETGGIAPFLLS
jgi:hypothetical protein